MKQLIYYIDKGNGHFEPFYEYMIPNVGADEFYARQLCTYFIMKGTQYELISNEMDGDGQEMVIFVTELTISYYGAHFISRYGCKEYFAHNKELLFYERQKEIISELEELEL